MSESEGTLHVGTSGYQYDHWKGLFYPEDLPKRQWFEHYAKRFRSVEINNTFYNLPAAETFDSWRERAGPGFTYDVKYSRYGSHIKRLKDPEAHVGLFVERVRRLGPRLGPVLVQLPPRWRPDAERLRGFVDVLPDDLRWTLEVRDPRWLCEEVFELLRERGVALCVHDRIEGHPAVVTAGFIYLRFHGTDYAGDYSQETLEHWAGRIRGVLAQGIDAYVYFNNDLQGHAIENAADLRRYVSMTDVEGG